MQEEEEKQKIQNDLRILTERLSLVNESLARKIAMRNDYDKTISETENAYKKVKPGGYFSNLSDSRVSEVVYTPPNTSLLA